MVMADLSLKREQDALIVLYENSARWFGLLFTGGTIAIFSSWDAGTRHGLGLFVVIVFVAIGGLMMLPWAITTVFDLRRRQVLIDVSSGYGFYRHSRDYAFADIAGLELWLDFENTSMGCPVLKLRNGETRKLAISYVSRAESEGFMAEICAATGLPRIADGRPRR